MDIEMWLEDRKSALLSLDKAKIDAYCKLYDISMPVNEEVYWRAVHKARTGMKDMPQDEKQKSKDWLKAHNSEHWDDAI